MTLTIEYFAVFKEQARTASESLEVDEPTLTSVFDLCRAKHSFALGPNQVRVAVNDEFVDWEYRLNDGDRVVFLPPVAGG